MVPATTTAVPWGPGGGEGGAAAAATAAGNNQKLPDVLADGDNPGAYGPDRRSKLNIRTSSD